LLEVLYKTINKWSLSLFPISIEKAPL